METEKEKQTEKVEETNQENGKEQKKLAITISILKEALERVDEEKIQRPLYLKALMLAKTSTFWPNLLGMLNLPELFKEKGNPVSISWVQKDQNSQPELAFVTTNVQVLFMAIQEELFSLAIFNRVAGKLNREISMPTMGIESTIRGLSILAVLLSLIIEDERMRIAQAKQASENGSDPK